MSQHIRGRGFRARVSIVAFMIGLGAFFVMRRAYEVQVADHEKYKTLADEQSLRRGLMIARGDSHWIDIDRLLAVFSLARADLDDERKVADAVRAVAARMPTYITLKDVKKRWGKGQEDVFPVAQFEKLWGDMTALSEVENRFVVVPRARGQQLKEPAQLDGWLRDGSAAYIESICDWS